MKKVNPVLHRLDPFDGSTSLKDMSEGNVGALVTLTDIIVRIGVVGKEWAEILYMADTLGIYGSRFFMLWTDCLNRNLDDLLHLAKRWRAGEITGESIVNHIDQGRSTPYEMTELYPPTAED